MQNYNNNRFANGHDKEDFSVSPFHHFMAPATLPLLHCHFAIHHDLYGREDDNETVLRSKFHRKGNPLLNRFLAVY